MASIAVTPRRTTPFVSKAQGRNGKVRKVDTIEAAHRLAIRRIQAMGR